MRRKALKKTRAAHSFFSTPNNASSLDIFHIKNNQLIILYLSRTLTWSNCDHHYYQHHHHLYYYYYHYYYYYYCFCFCCCCCCCCCRYHCWQSKAKALTLSKATNCRVFQTERVCRRQFQIC